MTSRGVQVRRAGGGRCDRRGERQEDREPETRRRRRAAAELGRRPHCRRSRVRPSRPAWVTSAVLVNWVSWRHGVVVGVVRRMHERSCRTSGQVSTRMGDCLLADTLSQQPNIGQLSLTSPGVAKSSTSFAGEKRECHLCRVAGNTVWSHASFHSGMTM